MDVCQHLIFFPSLFAQTALHLSRALTRMMHSQLSGLFCLFSASGGQTSRRRDGIKKVGRKEHGDKFVARGYLWLTQGLGAGVKVTKVETLMVPDFP